MNSTQGWRVSWLRVALVQQLHQNQNHIKLHQRHQPRWWGLHQQQLGLEQRHGNEGQPWWREEAALARHRVPVAQEELSESLLGGEGWKRGLKGDTWANKIFPDALLLTFIYLCNSLWSSPGAVSCIPTPSSPTFWRLEAIGEPRGCQRGHPHLYLQLKVDKGLP